MRTSMYFRVAFWVVMLFMTVISTNLKAQDANFVTNEVENGNLVVSKVIYKMDGHLFRYMKYDFTYDDQERMSSKEAFKWDSVKEKWTPYFKINYTYSSNEITLVYARWNNNHKAYDDAVEKSVYELNDTNMPIAYMNYKWADYKWVERVIQVNMI